MTQNNIQTALGAPISVNVKLHNEDGSLKEEHALRFKKFQLRHSAFYAGNNAQQTKARQALESGDFNAMAKMLAAQLLTEDREWLKENIHETIYDADKDEDISISNTVADKLLCVFGANGNVLTELLSQILPQQNISDKKKE